MSAETKPRKTRQQDAVRDALMGMHGFRSAQDVYAALRQAGETVGLSTVYRHLQSFADAELVDVIQTADGEATYRFCGDGTRRAHHHHLVCRRCGRAEEIEARSVERWATSVGKDFGFQDISHTVELFGTCSDCARAEAAETLAESS